VPTDLDAIRVLTKKQAQEVVGVSPRTWDRLEAVGDVPVKTRLSQNRIGYSMRCWIFCHSYGSRIRATVTRRARASGDRADDETVNCQKSK
jgi:hypothetical protein